jgi:arylsulfatase A-like enzyme
VRRHAKSDKPFCLYVSHEAIHNPVQVPGDPIRRTTEKWDRWKWKEVSKEERIAKYQGMTLPIDKGMGDLRRALVDLGIAKNTMVLFFSDNGPAGDFPSGSPGLRSGKGQVYEGGHKVPALVWWPGKVKPGTESNEPLISIDIMPTLLSLAGVQSTGKASDGVDFSNVFLRGKSIEPRPLYWASLSNRGQRSEAMRDGNWKLVVQHPKARPGTFENPKVELYNLANDAGEKTDLSKQQPGHASRMAKQLNAWFAETQKDATDQPGGWLAQLK